MQRSILCHYHEIALKKKNRIFFEEQLCRNIRTSLTGLPYESVSRRFGRIVVDLTDPSAETEIEHRLRHVFGIISLCSAWVCPPDLSEIQKNLLALIRERPFESFKIHARRADKTFPHASPEINRLVGSFIQDKLAKRVQMDSPDLTCWIHLVGRRAYLYFARVRGAGGLPVGSGGKVVVLLSGGIDSPVAAYKIMRRGCRAVFVHFHSFPHTSLESQEKVRELVALLNRYQYGSRLYRIPFAEAQRQIVAMTPADTRVLLYRRLMVRLAQKVAFRERAKALVTGDSIGQVASQTLENIHVVTQAAELPILRPLIAEDKEEIVHLARQIGTYPISIKPDEDCCSLFVPEHPETRARSEQIETAERNLDLDALLDDAFGRFEVEKTVFDPETTFDPTPARPGH